MHNFFGTLTYPFYAQDSLLKNMHSTAHTQPFLFQRNIFNIGLVLPTVNSILDTLGGELST